MKRQSPEQESLVYRYRCAAPIAGSEHIAKEVERMRDLWDALVRIERAAERQQIEAAAADDPELAALLAALDAAAQAAREAPSTQRASLVRAREAARRATWAPLAAWRKAHPDTISTIERARRSAVVEARKSSSAYWCNYNRVIEDYDRARKGVRQFGRRLQLADRKREDGCLTAQIQRTRSGLGAAPAELQNGAFRALSIGVVPPAAHDPMTFRGERRRLARTVCEIRVDADGGMAKFPLVYHRPLPADARVKSASIVWRPVAGRVAYWLCLTVTRPRPAPTVAGAGERRIVIEWTLQADGSLRVADDCVLERDWMDAMDRCERLQAAIDATHDDLIPRLQLDGVEGVRRTPGTTAEILRARRDNGLRVPPYAAAWLRLYLMWHRQMLALRERALGRRNEQYQLYARWLAQSCASLHVTTPILAALSQIERDTPEGGLRHRAAPHILIRAIEHQARKRGVAATIARAPVAHDAGGKRIKHLSRRQRRDLRSPRKPPDQPSPDQ